MKIKPMLNLGSNLNSAPEQLIVKDKTKGLILSSIPENWARIICVEFKVYLCQLKTPKLRTVDKNPHSPD